MISRTHPHTPVRPEFAQEWRDWVNQWRWDRFVTLTFNQPGNGRPSSGFSDPNMLALKDKLKEWDGRMQRKVVGSNWFEIPDHRLFCFYTLEKPWVNPHWHGLVQFYKVNDSERLRQGEAFDQWADPTWKKLVPSGSVDVKVIYHDEGAIDYVGKSLLDQLNYEYWVPPDEFSRP